MTDASVWYDAPFGQHVGDQRHGEPDDVGEASFVAFDERVGFVLNAVGACLAAPRAGVQIGFKFAALKRAHRNGCDVVANCLSGGCDVEQCDAGDDLVGGSGDRGQDSVGVGTIRGLAEDATVPTHPRVAGRESLGYLNKVFAFQNALRPATPYLLHQDFNESSLFIRGERTAHPVSSARTGYRMDEQDQAI